MMSTQIDEQPRQPAAITSGDDGSTWIDWDHLAKMYNVSPNIIVTVGNAYSIIAQSLPAAVYRAEEWELNCALASPRWPIDVLVWHPLDRSPLPFSGGLEQARERIAKSAGVPASTVKFLAEDRGVFLEMKEEQL